jgi:transcriptional regulator with XRE-family HTH domain
MPVKNRKSTLRQLFADSRPQCQEALARLAGLYRIRIDAVERGERNITVDHMEQLARALKLETADLVKPRG